MAQDQDYSAAAFEAALTAGDPVAADAWASGQPTTGERLEFLRGEHRAGTMSYGELCELQSLAEFIDPSDVELLEAAGVPESEG